MKTREESTAYARKLRDRKWLAKAQLATRCPHMHGGGRCGTRLEELVVDGRVTVRCPMCERRKRGICRDCPKRVAGRIGSALRCAECKEIAKKRQVAASEKRLHEKLKHLAKLQLRERMKDPAYRAKKSAYKRAWRLAQGKRRLEYAKRYNVGRNAKKRAEAAAKYIAENPVPTPKCCDCSMAIPWAARGMAGAYGRPPKRCVFCMDPSQVRASALRWAESDARPPKAKPVEVVRPIFAKRPMPTRFNDQGERLCFTRGCQTVVRGRSKKCESCRAEEQRRAWEVLRGREGAA